MYSNPWLTILVLHWQLEKCGIVNSSAFSFPLKASQDKKSLDVGANLFIGNLDPVSNGSCFLLFFSWRCIFFWPFRLPLWTKRKKRAPFTSVKFWSLQGHEIYEVPTLQIMCWHPIVYMLNRMWMRSCFMILSVRLE